MSFNYRVIFKILSVVTIIIGSTMLIPFITALIYHEWREAASFFIVLLVLILVGYVSFHYIKTNSQHLKMRDGYLVVASCWIFASALGALPYLASGSVHSVIDALFESVAAFTTTGATLVNLDTLPRSLLMWKGVCNWLGGMGILVFAISILPALGINGYAVVSAETPGIGLNKFATRISDSSKILYLFYFAFTVVEFLLLLVGPMDAYDALITTMGSVSTSGLTTMHNAFIYYNSLYVEVIICIFTFLAAINFTLYHHVLNRNWRAVFEDIELRGFITIIGIASILIVLNLYLSGTYNLTNSLRYGIFQVVSISTTSGFAIIGHNAWPSFCIAVLSILMLIGGCSFSTCGSIKVIRVLVMLKLIGRGFVKRIHPRSVYAVKLGSQAVSSQRVAHLTVFIMLYFIIILFSAILLSLQNLDLVTTLSSAIAMISNAGIGFGQVVNADYSIFCRPLRLVLCLLMIIGRLELFTVIVLFMPSFWNSDKYSYH